MRTRTRFYGTGLLVLVLLGLAMGFSSASELAQIDPTAQQQTVDALVQQRLQQMAATQTVEAAFQQALAATAAIEATVNVQIAEALAATQQANNSRVARNADWTPFVQEMGDVPMVLVPAGCFRMGSTAEEIARLIKQYGKNYADFFGPQHEQCFDTTFWIGQMEVTNRQYSAFIDAGGYTNAAYWTDAGWEWRQSEGVMQPGCWTERVFNQPNQPVICVTWYEAAAYSAWLSATSGQAFRLPTETEWEYAARGSDGLAYPWGNEWNADNLVWGDNSGDQPANVGSRPSGASWVGALDMSGNAWEWVSSQYQLYPYSTADGREDLEAGSERMVRGGSWSTHGAEFRCDFRIWTEPHFWGSFFAGFRLALS